VARGHFEVSLELFKSVCAVDSFIDDEPLLKLNQGVLVQLLLIYPVDQ
jgi:hypothetical protein